jgi:hypothetical protein
MKQFYFLFLLGLTSLFSSAQIELSFEGNLLTNGDTVEFTYYDSIIPIIIYTEFSVKNTSANSQDIVVRVDKSDMFPGTEVRMCWGPHCYGPLLDQTPNPQTLASNATNNSFQAKFLPNDHLEADGFVRFTFLDTLSPADSAWVICHYYALNETNTASIPNLVGEDAVTFNLMNGVINTPEENITIKAVYNIEGKELVNDALKPNKYFIVIYTQNGRYRAKKLFFHE